MTDISERVNGFITNDILHRAGADPLDPALNLLQEGILDSLGLQMLVAFLEESFSVTIPDERLLPENFESISAISGLVADLQN